MMIYKKTCYILIVFLSRPERMYLYETCDRLFLMEKWFSLNNLNPSILYEIPRLIWRLLPERVVGLLRKKENNRNVQRYLVFKIRVSKFLF